jgi:hypothetical protein
MSASASPRHPVAVIGAGPVGLAAAAQLLRRGLPVQVLEAGDGPAAHLQAVRHVRLFSPWRFNIDRAARELLEREGWAPPADELALPTAGELRDDYLLPLARSQALRPHIRYGARVIAISRERFDKVKTRGREQAPFVLQLQGEGGVEELRASAVIDASGTWGQPNPLGAHGLAVPGEREFAAQIRYGMPDILGSERARYAGRRVLVVGAGHSAAGNLLALAQLASEVESTSIVWAVRGQDLRRLFGGGSKDGLPARGELGTRLRALTDSGRLELHTGFAIGRIEAGVDGRLRVFNPTDARSIDGIDEIVAATGARPDLSLARELRLRLDPWLESTELLAPLIDPNEHSCGTVRPHGHRELAHPEAGFYAIGAKSYGRAPNFLMATGYEQARSVAAALAGDLAAADAVMLELPETGVCSTDFAAPSDGAACCARDEAMKPVGGCGCGSQPVSKPKAACCA